MVNIKIKSDGSDMYGNNLDNDQNGREARTSKGFDDNMTPNRDDVIGDIVMTAQISQDNGDV